jgi:collagen type XII alpha
LLSISFFLVVEPPSNLVATEVSSKYVKLSWDPSPSPVTGYKVLLTPMATGSRQHALSVGPQTTMLNVRDLSADMEYQISVYAMKGLTSSEPISIMEKTQPMKVQVGKLYHWVRNI